MKAASQFLRGTVCTSNVNVYSITIRKRLSECGLFGLFCQEKASSLQKKPNKNTAAQLVLAVIHLDKNHKTSEVTCFGCMRQERRCLTIMHQCHHKHLIRLWGYDLMLRRHKTEDTSNSWSELCTPLYTNIIESQI